VGADFTTGKGTVALGEGIGIVSTGVGEALIVGDAVAVGLGCALPDAHAATETVMSVATTTKPPCWVITTSGPKRVQTAHSALVRTSDHHSGHATYTTGNMCYPHF
jgi:hypothetical protein